MTVPTATEQPTVNVKTAAPWFGVSPATFYRSISDGHPPCDVVHIGSRVAVVVASARAVLGLDAPAANGEKDSVPNGTG